MTQLPKSKAEGRVNEHWEAAASYLIVALSMLFAAVALVL